MRDSRTFIPIITATDTGMAMVQRIPIAHTGMKRKIRRHSRMAKKLANTVLAAMLLAPPVAGNAQSEPPSIGATQGRAAPLVIGSGDLLNVSIFDSPELSGRFRVDHNGDLGMPLLEAVHVAGLTAAQAAKRIEDQYVKAEILVPESSRSTVLIEEY